MFLKSWEQNRSLGQRWGFWLLLALAQKSVFKLEVPVTWPERGCRLNVSKVYRSHLSPSSVKIAYECIQSKILKGKAEVLAGLGSSVTLTKGDSLQN